MIAAREELADVYAAQGKRADELDQLQVLAGLDRSMSSDSSPSRSRRRAPATTESPSRRSAPRSIVRRTSHSSTRHSDGSGWRMPKRVTIASR